MKVGDAKYKVVIWNRCETFKCSLMVARKFLSNILNSEYKMKKQKVAGEDFANKHVNKPNGT